MNNKQSLLQRLGSMTAAQVVKDDEVKAQFVNVYNTIWGEGGEAACEKETMNFVRALSANEKLKKSTPISVMMAFMDLAVRGLSLDAGAQALCYLLPRNTKVVNHEGKEAWETRCSLAISGYGELAIRKEAGQILHADNPVVVYEGDEFSYGERDGQKYVNYSCTIPRKSNRIIACFLKITRPDNSIDYSVMTPEDWTRLAGFSEKNNSYYDANTRQRVSKANELYSSNEGQIDTGFLVAKCIKHAFKTYPKIKIGKASVMESELPDKEADFDPYAGVDQTPAAPTPAPQETFAPTPAPQGVTIAPQDDSDDTF